MRPLSEGGAPRGVLAAGSRRGPALLGLLIALVFLSACTLWPRPDPASRGQRLYLNICTSVCHGKEGDQVSGVSLFSKQFLEERTNEKLTRTISEGSKTMLPFSKARGGPLSDEDIQDIVGYMRSRTGVLERKRVAAGEPVAASTAPPSTRPPSGGGISAGGLARNGTYARYCVACHKEDGLGVSTAPLGYRDFVARLGQDGLARSIIQGKGPMPPWGKAKGGPLSETEVAGLAAYILASASSNPPPTAVAPTATPTAQPADIGAPALAAASGSPGKVTYDQFCAGCHPVPSAIAGRATRESAMKYVPGLTEGQADIILDYLRGPEATQTAPTTTPGGPLSDSARKPPPSRTSAGGEPPNIPHSVEGKEGLCLQCHGRGAMAPYPVGHTGRTVETCVLCHVASPRPAPPMAHALGDRAGRCFLCHESGGIASRVPANHAGRSTDTCTFCH